MKPQKDISRKLIREKMKQSRIINKLIKERTKQIKNIVRELNKYKTVR